MSVIEIGDTFRYLDADVRLIAVGPSRYGTREGEACIEALTKVDADELGWMPCTDGTYQGITDLREFLSIAEPITLERPTPPPADAPQDHGPLAAILSDRTLAKVLSRPAHVPRGSEPLINPNPTLPWSRIVAAALRWDAVHQADASDVTPIELFDADDALHMAVAEYNAGVAS